MSKPGTQIREHLIRALQAELVGPFELDDPDSAEVLPLAPSRWYLTGFLAPKQAREQDDDPTALEDHAAGSDLGGEEDTDDAGADAMPKIKQRLPASIGLSVLLPPGDESQTITVTVRWADYALVEPQTDAEALRPDGSRRRTVWKRVPVPAKSIELALDPRLLARGYKLEGVVGVWLRGSLRPAEAEGLEPGTRALSLFVVNERPSGERGRVDEQFMFQVELALEFAGGIVARPDLRGDRHEHRDDLLNDLQFRARTEWAVGHGVAVAVPKGQAPVTRVETTWIPRAEVLRVTTRSETRTELCMEELARLEDPAQLKLRLWPLVEEYGEWLESLRDEGEHPVGNDRRREVRDELVIPEAEDARRRIAEGIELLAADPVARRAFCLANQAMHDAALQRSPERYAGGDRPTWRLFQLAFVLLCVRGVVEEDSDDRRVVDLIFFPTGGGKTEAYLGVIAFSLVLRRLHGRSRPDRGLGVAVILRYTLRLLTLDQMGRASTLICALERLRQRHEGSLGETRFSVGLWVGKSATANTMKEVAERIDLYKAKRSKKWPCPLTDCPWCRGDLVADSLDLQPSPAQPKRLVLGCDNDDCPFCPANDPRGLPVLFIDEAIYQELPSFIVATVDKFAMLPWRAEAGKLFGKVVAREGERFLGPGEAAEGKAEPLPEGLRGPELIVQDELHLISGPLGTMVGLYETALEHLSSEVRTHERDGELVDEVLRPPKIIAATATVRRANEQIRALFGRNDVRQFPPPGVDDQETWFSTIDDARDEHGELKSPGRLYVGVAAPGRAMKAILLRTYATLLAAAQHEYQPKGDPKQPADAYMTVVGYFNALRELGGMRRLVVDDVRTRCAAADERRPLGYGGPHPWAARRAIELEPVELNSRRPTDEITQSKRRLDHAYAEREHQPVDVVLASNMISVGVDIDRLGLMVVAGQPKTTAEYIQATSRVGRQVRWPGLVVTCFNVAKPRDRSHYERFTAYHDSFYRFVEAPSVTPLSGPALERGLAATLVAMARFSTPELSAHDGAERLRQFRAHANRGVRALARRAAALRSMDAELARRQAEEVRKRAEDLLDDWEAIVERNRDEDNAATLYSRYDRRPRGQSGGAYLLHTVLDEGRPPPNSKEAKFSAPTSMRDVEASVHLWLRKYEFGGSE
ncbi:MAG: DISARM system helicase DrmA [Enhygromyxa sp.]